METKTRFDLNAAVQNWQDELAAQPGLTQEVRRELETHIRDTVTELQRRGLNDEESFWLARRRAGQPRQLAEEFAKADPAKIWRERLFWITLIFFLMEIWGRIISYSMMEIYSPANAHHYSDCLRDVIPSWVSFYLPQWLTEMRMLDLRSLISTILRPLPLFCLGILLSKRVHITIPERLKTIFSSRAYIVFCGIVLQTGCELFRIYKMREVAAQITSLNISWMTVYSLLPLFLIVFIAWLMPSKKCSVLEKG